VPLKAKLRRVKVKVHTMEHDTLLKIFADRKLYSVVKQRLEITMKCLAGDELFHESKQFV
jgi:hypothetical protein